MQRSCALSRRLSAAPRSTGRPAHFVSTCLNICRAAFSARWLGALKAMISLARFKASSIHQLSSVAVTLLADQGFNVRYSLSFARISCMRPSFLLAYSLRCGGPSRSAACSTSSCKLSVPACIPFCSSLIALLSIV